MPSLMIVSNSAITCSFLRLIFVPTLARSGHWPQTLVTLFTAFAPGARFVIVAAGAENVRLSRLVPFAPAAVQARQFGPEASMTAALFKSEFDCWLHQQEPLAWLTVSL